MDQPPRNTSSSFYTGHLPQPSAFSTDPYRTQASLHAGPHRPQHNSDPPPVSRLSRDAQSHLRPQTLPKPTGSPQTGREDPFHFQPRPPQPQLQPTHTTAPQHTPPTATTAAPSSSAKPTNFDVIDWSTAYASCQRYFLDHGQHEPGTQAMAALINILLPFQWREPVHSSTPPPPDPQPARNQTNTPPEPSAGPSWYFPQDNSTHPDPHQAGANKPFVSLLPYIRRMIVTGYAAPQVLYGLFGSEYKAGILPLVEIERRNYLFTAKSVGWARTKREYDMGEGQSCPFLNPLEDVSSVEVGNAEGQWGRWLCMEDWVWDHSPQQGAVQEAASRREEDARRDETRREDERRAHAQAQANVQSHFYEQPQRESRGTRRETSDPTERERDEGPRLKRPRESS